MLVASGLLWCRFSGSADRCEAFELRIWARVFDKNLNLEADDYVDLKLLQRCTLRRADVSSISQRNSAMSLTWFICHLATGIGKWWACLTVMKWSDHSHFWRWSSRSKQLILVGNLPETLGRLRSSCAALFEAEPHMTWSRLGSMLKMFTWNQFLTTNLAAN